MIRRFTGAEKDVLLAFLDQQRDAIVWKTDGLTDDQLRQRPLAPSRLYLLGLVKHLATVEQYWLCELFGRPTEPISHVSRLAASDDLEAVEDDTRASVLDYYTRARAAANDTVNNLDLDTTAPTWVGETVSLRWAILHTIEETTRHTGHADLVREHIDGTTGYLPENRPY